MKLLPIRAMSVAISLSLSSPLVSLLGLLPEKNAIAVSLLTLKENQQPEHNNEEDENTNFASIFYSISRAEPKKSIKEIQRVMRQINNLQSAIADFEGGDYEKANLIKEAANAWFYLGSLEYKIYEFERSSTNSDRKDIEAYEKALALYDKSINLYSNVAAYPEKLESLMLATNTLFILGRYNEIQVYLSRELNDLSTQKAYKQRKMLIESIKFHIEYRWGVSAAEGLASELVADRIRANNISWQELLEISKLNLFILEQLNYSSYTIHADSTVSRVSHSDILHGLGWSYRNLGNYNQALYYLNQAIKAEKKDRGRANSLILIDLATVYTDMGQYSRSLEILKLAKASDQVDQALNRGHRESLILARIGFVYKELGQYERALAYLEKALFVEIRSGNYEHVYLNYIGETYLAIGEYEKALEAYEDIIRNPRVLLGEQDANGFMFSNLGRIYAQLGRLDEAVGSYEKALTIFRILDNRSGESQVLSNIAFLLEDLDQPELAIAFHKEAVNITESIRSDVSYLPIEAQQSYLEKVSGTYRRLADLLLQENRVLEAQRVLDLLKVHELDDYLRGVQRNAQTESGITIRPEEQEALQRFAAQSQLIGLGRELLELEAIDLSERTPEQTAQIRELRQLQVDARAVFQTFLESDEIQALVAQLRQTTGATNLELSELNTLQDNLRKLEQNAVVLYPLVLEDRLELIIVTANAPPLRRTVSISREDLNRGIAEMRSALQSPISDAVTPAQQLYDWLIRPIEADLEQANADTIIYAPDSQLRYIPLAALHDGNQWLTERFRVNNITAASIDDLDNAPTPELHILAAAFSEGQYTISIRDRTLSFGGLEYAGREVENLSQLIPQTETRLNEAFDSGIVLDMNDFNVVHLATHATFNPGPPEDSFILFGDGSKATLTDIKSWNFPNVELVVLSACETAVGDVPLGNGEEILGFGYLMQLAGSDAAIASLWAVDDGGTQVLMNAFYSALHNGNSKAEALRQAQIALIEQDFSGIEIRDRRDDGTVIAVNVETGLLPAISNRLNHPYYWAPFILIGNGL